MLWKCCTQYASIWKTQQWPQEWKGSVFIPIPKKGNAKECSNYHTIVLISHTSKVMLKILQARLQKNMNHEFPDVQAGFRKGRGIRDQIANSHWIIKKAREFHKNIYFCFIDYIKAFDCVDQSKLWKKFFIQEMRIPDHLTCLLRNLYAGQEATVKTQFGTANWFQIGKGVHKGYILNEWRVVALVTRHECSEVGSHSPALLCAHHPRFAMTMKDTSAIGIWVEVICHFQMEVLFSVPLTGMHM